MSKRRDKKLNKETSRRTELLLSRAWRLLQNMTPMERKLERDLLAGGVLYRPQWLMEPWIVDFYLVDYGIVVEVDGSSHDGRGDADWARSSGLLRRSDVVRIVRVTNDQVAAGVSVDDLLSGDFDHRRPTGFMTKGEAKAAVRAAKKAEYNAALAARPGVFARKPGADTMAAADKRPTLVRDYR